MANAIKMLQDDHNSVRILFGSFHQIPAGQGDQAATTAAQIASLLKTHTALEEELVYPVLAELAPEMVDEAKDEHDEAKRLLSEIEKTDSGTDGKLSALLTELQAAFTAHVEKEEDTVFPLLTEKLGVSQLEELGRVMLGRQQELLHEHASTTDAASAGRPQVTYPKI